MEAECTDSFETTGPHVGLPFPVVAPAGDRVVGTQPATMSEACTDSFEFTCWHIGVHPTAVSPAGDRVVGTYPATMVKACADSFETTCRVGGGVAAWGCGVDGYLWFVLVAVQEGNELGSSQGLVRSEGGG